MDWTRPSNIKYPKVWHRFTKRDLNGIMKKFKVQDLTEEFHQDIMELLMSDFIFEEPWLYNSNIAGSKESVEVFVDFYENHVIPLNLSLVCIEDNNKKLIKKVIGFDMLSLAHKDNGEDYSEFSTSQNSEKFLKLYETFHQSCPNIFLKYNTETYVCSNGLFVVPKFRGMQIGEEILKSRKPLCKAMGIKITASNFTTLSSQKSASKAGYKEEASVSYDVLRNISGFDFDNCIDCKFMSMQME